MKFQTIAAFVFAATVNAKSLSQDDNNFIFFLKKPTVLAMGAFNAASVPAAPAHELLADFASVLKIDGNFTAANGVKFSKEKAMANKRRNVAEDSSTNWITVDLASEEVAQDIFRKNKNIFAEVAHNNYHVALPKITAHESVTTIDFETQVIAEANTQCKSQNNAILSLARLSMSDTGSSANADATGTYTYPNSAGSGVYVYILDTGVNSFGASDGGYLAGGLESFDFTGEGTTDQQGHGSHVAGTVASKSWGVAKKAHIVSVKVLNSQGSGTLSGITDGLDQVYTHWTSNGKPKAVVSMSLGTSSPVSSINDKVNELVQLGVPCIVAAGNENKDARASSPASAASAITVGSLDLDNKRSYFSNYGSKVNIFAYGRDISSTCYNNRNRVCTSSGTSMACPYVSGVAATVMAEGTTSAGLLTTLDEMAIKNQITDSKTPNGNVMLRSLCQS